uniref:Putative ABC-type transport system, permease component n=1 Tax=mine drainage metagenome TaxID=410659 RepID=E6PK65_9ZZZZ
MQRLLPLSGPLALLLLWQVAVSSHWVNPVLLPSPGATTMALWNSLVDGSMWPDLRSTLLRTFEAFALAAVIGVPLGVALGSAPAVYRSVEFLVDFFRSTPSSALIPLFMLLFGLSDLNKVAISAFAAVLLILFNSAYGVMNARKTRVLAVKVMGVSRWHVFKDVLLLESLPQTFVGLRTGVSMALVIVIVAEMFIGSDTGLGQRIINAQQVLNIKGMYAAILLTGVLGYVLNLLFSLIERRFVHWSGK